MANRFYIANDVHCGVYEKEPGSFKFDELTKISDGIKIYYRTDEVL